MRIIDNKKDYYDYLAGKYGIDEQIVFDRRGSYRVNGTQDPGLMYCFNLTRQESDAPKTENKPLPRKNRWRFQWERDRYSFLVMEVGTARYQFKIKRYLDKNGKVYIDVAEWFRIPDCKKMTERVIAFISREELYLKFEEEGKITYEFSYSSRRLQRPMLGMSEELIKIEGIPILEGTFIPAVVPAEQIWFDIYDYLSSLKDKKIVDNRTDIQKLESAGFDKKTSFRKV